MEQRVLDWIQAHLRCELLDVLMPAVSRVANHGEIWILLTATLLLVRGYRRQGISVGCALALDYVSCNLLLKPLVGRLRPFMVNTAVELLVAAPGDASFPSGHTAVSFAAAFALKYAGNSLWKPAAVLAALIAFSRLYLYVHWPSDVLAGILLGWLCGLVGVKLTEMVGKRTAEP